MPGPTTPDTALASAAAALETQLLALDDALVPQEFSAASGDGKINATASASGDLVALTIHPSLLTPAAGPGLPAALMPVINAALTAGQSKARADLKALVAGFSLPGFPAQPPASPDMPGFREAATAFRCAMLAQETQAAKDSYLATAGAGKIQVTVNGLLVVTAITFDASLFTSMDAPNTAGLVRDALNAALRDAREDVTCDQTGTATTFAGKPRPSEQRPRCLLVVENASNLRTSDQKLRDRLIGLGFEVEIKKAPNSATADAHGRTVIVISETVDPNDVGTKFLNAAVPMVVCEPVSFRDLKMTGGTWGTDKGDATNQTKLQITAGHPLAAGLSGQVTVVSTASKFVWGNPSSAARKVAAIFGTTNKWGIFAYDTGDSMVGQNAPARRVGFFTGQDTFAALNADGLRLFDAAVRWATAAKALFTVGATPLSAGDQAMKERLAQRHGLDVLVRLDTDTKTSDLKDMRVHVISESVDSGTVAARFLTSPAPTLVCEAKLLDDMKLTGTVFGTDNGEVQGATQLDVKLDHPLAAGLSGVVDVEMSGQKFAWGKTGSEAIKVAEIITRPDNWGVFAYESGANMVGQRATAPRVGFFASAAAAVAFKPAGTALFDAAVRWARKPRALLVVETTATLRASEVQMKSRLEEVFGFIVDLKTAVEVIDKHTDGKRVVIISESVTSGDITTRLNNVTVGVVVMEPGLWDDMKLVASSSDKGDTDGLQDLEIVSGTHPLAAGLAAGNVQVVSPGNNFGWGRPTSSAAKVARVVGTTDHWAVFAYETGATMAGSFTAPARRVGFFPGRDTPASFTNVGKKLFDAAVFWAASPLASFDECLEQVHGQFPGDGGQPPVAPPTMTTWQVGVFYNVGDEVVHNGLQYRCRQAHTSQSDWAPPVVYALWERINAGSAWAVQVIYKTGDEVTFSGHRYRCIQGHQAQPDWEPPDVPALWQQLD
jgi:DNA-binding protein YbaB/chitodextrinase